MAIGAGDFEAVGTWVLSDVLKPKRASDLYVVTGDALAIDEPEKFCPTREAAIGEAGIHPCFEARDQATHGAVEHGAAGADILRERNIAGSDLRG
jgi:hypothetical protein